MNQVRRFMNRVITPLGNRWIKQQSPILQPFLRGWLTCYEAFYLWCWSDYSRKGRLITNRMSDYDYKK